MRSLGLLAGVVGLAALVALALAALGSVGAQGPGGPEGVELRLSLVDDSDGVVRAGSTISVAAELRLEPWEETLTLSSGSVWLYGASRAQGAHVWEADGRPRLTLSDQTLLQPLEQSGEIIAYTNNALTTPLTGDGRLRVLAYHRDTVVARAQNNTIYVYHDGAQVAMLGVAGTGSPAPPHPSACAIWPGSTACQPNHNAQWGWARGDLLNPPSVSGIGDPDTRRPLAVWQEDDDTAWLFIGSNRESLRYPGENPRGDAGAVYIYELDYSTNPATATRRHLLYPPTYGELVAKPQHNLAIHWGQIGTAVAISADGGTLAVGAPRLHATGVVHVWTRPAGGWGASLGWNDSVMVAPVVIPAWGDSNTERPFNSQSTGRTGGSGDCDAYCSRVVSYAGGGYADSTLNGADFGTYVALSADGSVLAVSAPHKRFPSNTPGGSGAFNGRNSGPFHGEVLVFVAPEGGWSAVPNYKTGRSQINYGANANGFDPMSHYSEGVNKRVHEPTWSFEFDWTTPQSYYLGERLALSPDGTTLAANDRINDAVNIFQVDSPGGWAEGPTAPSAQITGVTDGGQEGGFDFNAAGGRFGLGDPAHTSNQGRLLIFERPADGSWVDATAADAAEVVLAPTEFYRRTNENYGRGFAWSLNDPLRWAVSAWEREGSTNVGPGRFWTGEDRIVCPISERTDEGGETTRTTVCSVALGDTRVVIPRGTPDGTFSIAGTVTLAYGDGQTLERTARLEVEVGTVQEVASAKLDFAVDDRGTPNDLRDDRPHRSTLNARGDSTVLRLQILNEREKASAAGSAASVVATTTAGSLSTTLGNGCRGGGGNACEIDVSALTVSNTANIPLTLTHGGTGGTAQVEVLVVARADGEDYRTEPLAVTLAGAATALSVAEAAGALLNVGTPDNSGPTLDNRDVLELTATARDALGHQVPVPTRGASARITGPDGKQVPSSKIAVQWPLSAENCATGGIFPAFPLVSGGWGVVPNPVAQDASAFSANQNGHPLCVSQGGQRYRAYDAQSDDFPVAINTITIVLRGGGLTREFAVGDLRSKARLNVNAEASEPLAAGEYTLELRAGGLTATQVFRVSGGAAALALSEPDGRLALGQRVSVTATVSDSEGNAVSDGTPVVWSATDVGTNTVLVQISADAATRDGSASSVWQVVGAGRSTVRAVAGNAANVRLVDVPAVVVAPPGPEASLSSRAPGLTAWQGEGRTSARALLAGLEGVSGLLLWTPGGWLGYALREGAVVPGSFDFEVTAGSVLWLAE